MIYKSKYKLVYFIFFLSGISGLIYETVWLRVLSRVLGYTVYANSIVISAFMLGLSIGSYIIGKKSDSFKNLFKTYAVLEILVGITSVLAFIFLNNLGGIFKFFYQAVNENRSILYLIQSVIVFIILVVPTFLMGGTLPLLAAALKSYKGNFARNIGNLYGLNTFGAVFGVLLSGFIAIGFIGELNTILISMLLNFIVGLIALFILTPSFNMQFTTSDQQLTTNIKISPYPLNIRNIILITYALIGFSSFAIEIIWTRIFQLQLGTSIYAFSMVLGIYLLGSAIGSIVFAKVINYFNNTIVVLGYVLIFLSLYVLVCMFIFTFFTPSQLDIQFKLGISKVIIPIIVIFPFTFLLGFLFPLVSDGFVTSKNKIGNNIGVLYSLNTLGCITGALLTGYVLIRFIGTRNSMIFISFIIGILGYINLIIGLKFLNPKSKIVNQHSKMIGLKWIKFQYISSSILLLIIFIIGKVVPDPFYSVIKNIISSNENSAFFYNEHILFHKEGIAATTTVLGNDTYYLDKYLLVNGVGMTKLDPVTKIMAHLPILLNKESKDALIICFGMGTCLRSAVSHSNINCDVVELVAEEYEAFNYFHKNGSQILADKRVHHYVDDGRNFLLLKKKKYDVITIDPAPPLWSAGSVNLYSSNFFTLCKEHLNTNGLLCLWVPPFNLNDIKMIMRTFITVFANNTLYKGPTMSGFYLIGSRNIIKIDSNNFKDAANDKSVMNDLNEWGNLFTTPLELLKYKIADSTQLKLFLKDQRVITDNYPYTEFPLWRKIDWVDADRFKSLMDLRNN